MSVVKVTSFLTDIKDWSIRKVATFFILKYIDGYKTNIMRILQGVTLIIFALAQLFPEVSVIVDISTQWFAILALINQFGLEFSIADADIKRKLDIPVNEKSLKLKFNKGT